jgi:integrase
MVRAKELAGVNVVESLKTARTTIATVTATFPKLDDALGEWIDAQVASKALRSATARCYRHALKAYTAPHHLADGRALGGLTVNEVTRPMLGEVLTKLRNRGVSQSVLYHVRNPLRKYFENLVETGSLVTSPAADLKHFMGRQRRKRTALLFFTEKEGPVLLGAAKEFYPRWHTFIMTSMLAGLRWGEVAALQRGDIDFRRGRLHVQRTVSVPTKSKRRRITNPDM